MHRNDSNEWRNSSKKSRLYLCKDFSPLRCCSSMSWQHNSSRPLQLTLSAYEWSWSKEKTHWRESQTEPSSKNPQRVAVQQRMTAAAVPLRTSVSPPADLRHSAGPECFAAESARARPCLDQSVWCSLGRHHQMRWVSVPHQTAPSWSLPKLQPPDTHLKFMSGVWSLSVATEKHLSWFTLQSRYWLMMLSVM